MPLRLLVRLLAVVALVVAVLAAASSARVAAGSETLTIYAASSLTAALTALKPAFEKKNPGMKVRYNFAASSTLRTQIEQGAPADVFAAADYAAIQPLIRAHLVLAPRTFARNRLVIVVPQNNPAGIRSPKDLARRGLRLGATAATVPIGRYTLQVLVNLARLPGYPRDFARRVTENVVTRELNVRALLGIVGLGEADAAIVYETDARTSRRVRQVAIPDVANVTAIYPIAAVTASGNRAGAEAFVRFVFSDEAQAVLRRLGFR